MTAVITDVPEEDRYRSSAMLTVFMRSVEAPVPYHVYPIPPLTFHYANPATPPKEFKFGMMEYMPPVYSGTFVPLSSLSNDAWAASGRVVKLRDAPHENMGLRPNMNKYAKEFADFFLPQKHSLEPVSYEEVRLRMDRPTQRERHDTALIQDPHLSFDDKLESFVKKESYDEVKEPRMITMFPGSTTVEYARFIYALNDHIKTMKWYAFGKNPAQLAQRVVEVCLGSNFVIEGDASRMDGRISQVVRFFELYLLYHCFTAFYHSVLETLHMAQYNRFARTMHGFKYFLEYGRASGSMETSFFNSFLSALMCYMTYRRQGLSPEAAWNKLGVYGGDDTLSADIDPVLYVETAEYFGQIMKVRIVRPPMCPTFLARIFLNPWTGIPDSICDVPRALRGLHLRVASGQNLTLKQNLEQKLAGYARTDFHSPIFRVIISTLCHLNWNLDGQPDTWWGQFHKDVQWPNTLEAVIQHERLAAPYFYDYNSLMAWSDHCRATNEFHQIPCVMFGDINYITSFYTAYYSHSKLLIAEFCGAPVVQNLDPAKDPRGKKKSTKTDAGGARKTNDKAESSSAEGKRRAYAKRHESSLKKT